MRDLSGIYKESKQSLFIFSPHKVSSFWNVSCHDRFPTSHTLLLFQCFPESPRGSLCLVLIFPPQIGTCKYLHFWSFAAYAFFLIFIIIIINSVVVVLCSSLQFRYLMRAAVTERWPVFVCLWAKHHWLCCVRLSFHCNVKRVELNTASGSPESAGCRWQVTDRSEEEDDCWSTELTSVYLTCLSMDF